MNRKLTHLMGVGLTGLCLTATATAAPVLSDGFGDGDRDNDGTAEAPATDATDIGTPFYKARGTSSLDLGVATDDGTPGIGDGNALDVTIDTTSSRVLGANFTSTTLANVGDKITLSYDLRITSDTITPDNRAFRFGLFNSNGTVLTGDSSSGDTPTNNDAGYTVRLSPGAASEANNNADIFIEASSGGRVLGGSGDEYFGADSNAAGVVLSSNNTRRIVLSIEKADDDAVTNDPADLRFTLSLDGTEYISRLLSEGGDAVDDPSTQTFNELLIGNDGDSALNFRIDNVSVDFTPGVIPEPASLGLLGVGGAVMLVGRRRR